MKKIVKVLVSLIMLIYTSINLIGRDNPISAKDFYALPETKQDSVLVALAKSVIMEHGPDWYSESYQVKIIKDWQINDNRFIVDFYHDKDINEYFKKGSYACGASIDVTTLKPVKVYFGNEKFIDLRVQTRDVKKEIMPFGPSPHQIDKLPDGAFD